MKKKKARRRRPGGIKKFFLIICAVTAAIILILKYTNEMVMPSVIKTVETIAENKSMRAIDSAVKSVITVSGITTSDLYMKSTEESGKLTSLTANTMLINNLCSDVAEESLTNLEMLEEETVYLPLGIITGIDFLATKGPPVFKVTLKPMGRCAVDYKTSFKSEGINQVNYQIWLEIKANISIVNPLVNKSIAVERQLPIVNTYIGGEVPGSMMYPFKINGD